MKHNCELSNTTDANKEHKVRHEPEGVVISPNDIYL